MDRNPLDQQKCPRKLRKNLSLPSRASTKDLKIISWRPPTTQSKIMLSLPANVEHGEQECLKDLACQTANHYKYISKTPCRSQDGNATCLTSSDTPELTDTSSVFSSPFAVSSVPCTVPINPQILRASTTILCHSDGGLGHPNEWSLSEQLESYSSAERPRINFPSQMSYEDPTLRGIKSQGVVVLETDNIPNNHQSLTSSFFLGKNLEQGLASNEPPAVEQLSSAIKSSFDMGTIGSKIVAEFASTGPFTRSKAREEASKRNHTIYQSSIQKAKPYSQKKDQLLKRLMRKATTVQDVTKKFSVYFSGQSTTSLEKHWLLIQPPLQRSTRSRSIRHPT